MTEPNKQLQTAEMQRTKTRINHNWLKKMCMYNLFEFSNLLLQWKSADNSKDSKIQSSNIEIHVLNRSDIPRGLDLLISKILRKEYHRMLKSIYVIIE